MQIEEWKEIKELPGFSISSHGRVRGLTGRIYKGYSGRGTKGYYQYRFPLYGCTKKAHRLVAQYFIEAEDRSLQVNHKDGNKSNNHYSNLEYVSCRENIQHAIKTGLRSATINLKSKTMFDNAQISVIRDCFAAGLKNTEISKYFKCDHSTISKIRRGRNYSKILNLNV